MPRPERRPSNDTLFAPACPATGSVPARIVRVQLRLPLFFFVWATQLLPLRRPGVVRVNLNATLAATLRLKEKIVPD